MLVITGGAGFVGSVLGAHLNELGRSDLVLVDAWAARQMAHVMAAAPFPRERCLQSRHRRDLQLPRDDGRVGAACGIEPIIEYVDMPAAIRSNYQYFTQALIGKLRQSSYTAPFTPLEAAVKIT